MAESCTNFYRQTEFITSAQNLKQSPPDHGYEIAFVGRSNSGKSSSINSLCDQKSLARTSRTPGRTQLINFFKVDSERRIVDLPGYGYAAVPKDTKMIWQLSLIDYLEFRECLKGVVLVMDIRHPLKENDLQIIKWSNNSSIPVHILLSKIDKINKTEQKSTLDSVSKHIEKSYSQSSVQLFSSLKKWGMQEFQEKMDSWFELNI